MYETENRDNDIQRRQMPEPVQAASGWQKDVVPAHTLPRPVENIRPEAVDIMRTWGILLTGGITGILVVLALFFLFSQSAPQQAGGGTVPAGAALEQSSPPPAPRVGRVAPDFTLSRVDGTEARLSDYKGQPVWINFWATWCPPCRAEMPEMQQKYRSLKEKGLVVLGVDVGEDASIVEEYIAERNFDWTFLLDKGSLVAEQYGNSGLPYHVFVGRDGTIKAIQVGGMPGNVMDRYLSMIVDY